MQLRSDETSHFDKTYSPSQVRASGNCSTLRLPPTPYTLPIGKFQDEAADRKWVLKLGNYSLRLTDSTERRREANALIERMYSWRGYHTQSAPPVSSYNQTALEASSGQELAGTLTLGADSNEGLLADKLYRPEIDKFRGMNRKVCELSKLAIDPEYSSKELLAALFNLAYLCGRIIHKATDFVIEINPRHAAYYKRMLGFCQISETRVCQRVNAPAVLLHLDLDYVRAQVSCLAGSRKPRERSLYPHFLTEHEEKWVANGIRSINRAATFNLTAPTRLS